MSDFPEIYFGEVVEFFKNGTTATQVPVKTSKAVTRIETISDGKIDQNKLGYVSNNEDVERYRLNEGDILFSHINSIKHIGKTALVPEVNELFNGMNLLQIRPNREITDPKFLHELLNSETIRQGLRRIAKQAVNQASISIGQLQGISFSLPPLPEQKKIAEILSGIDTYLARLKQCLHRHRILKTALLQALIPSHNDLSEKKYSAGWKTCSLEEICSLITYGFTNPMPTSKKGISMVTAKDIKEGFIDFNSARFTTEEAYFELLTRKSRPEKGDVLVTKDGTLGRTAIVDNERLCINQSVALLRPAQLEDAEYIHLLLSSPFYQRMMIGQSGGSAIKHIYITTLAKMQIVIPETKSLQDQVVKTIKQKNLYLNSLLRKIQQVENLKNALSSDLLSGRNKKSSY